MNWFIFIAGIIAAMTVVGHFTVGRKDFLVPLLDSSIDDVPKKVLHCVFHYISAFLVISTLALLAVGAGVKFKSGYTLLVDFIAIHYATFAVIQLVIALRSKIPKPAFKLFQWIFFSLTAIFAWLGIL
ncbi:hypothetical protein LCGC14_2094520 [marine sediment metagenome]|uniref:Uncharacterized protein n=1 Tax=marine sediment metagenome TaxID=412755 RepID=A0A0F9EC00_9ZZZZ